MVDRDPVQQWLEERRAKRNAPITVLSAYEIERRIAEQRLSNPQSEIYKSIVPKILTYATQRLSPFQISGALINAYNETVENQELSSQDGAILLACLDFYAHAFSRDGEIVRMIREEVTEAVDMTLTKLHRSK